MNKLAVEIMVIIAISALLGIVYNASIPTTKTTKPLALFPEKRAKNAISDSALAAELGDISVQPAGDTVRGVHTVDSISLAQFRRDSIQRVRLVKDSILKIEQAKRDSLKTAQVPTETVSTAPKEIRYDQAKMLFERKVLFMDARPPHQHAEGNIPNSMNVDVQDFETNIPRIIGLPREQPIVVYCGGGTCDLSHELADRLATFGFKKVYIYTGGWEEWKTK
ncbi:MAG TPA: rhodanese-like domain-containing protein [Patescibacteria group bacterium]|nr:rhodanese-like domain-containing protein [Patescibacteria group bacterium]